MKPFLIFLIIALLSYLAGIWYPWWSVAVVAFAVVLIVPLRPAGAFVIGFLAVFALWASLAFYQGLMNDHILDTRIAQLIVHQRSPLVMVLVTGLTGGLVAAFAALAAACLRAGRRSDKQSYA